MSVSKRGVMLIKYLVLALDIDVSGSYIYAGAACFTRIPGVYKQAPTWEALILSTVGRKVASVIDEVTSRKRFLNIIWSI